MTARRAGSPSGRTAIAAAAHASAAKSSATTPYHPHARPGARRSAFDLPLPEDRLAIQSSIGQVLQRIASNDIDPRRAGLLLYGLQIASLNLPRNPSNHTSAQPAETVEEVILDPALGPLAPVSGAGKSDTRRCPIAELLDRMCLAEDDPLDDPQSVANLKPQPEIKPDPESVPSILSLIHAVSAHPHPPAQTPQSLSQKAAPTQAPSGLHPCHDALRTHQRCASVNICEVALRASTPLSDSSRVPNRSHELSAEEQSIYRQLDPAKIPQHVAIIMDGNGRWAGKRALKRFLGHQKGAESVQFVVETASRINLPWLTLYAFSLENNLRRPKSEVSFLMKLLKNYLVGNVKRMNDNNVRMAYIGRTYDLPQEVQDTMQWASEATAKNTGTTLTLALNYGARSEIVDAVRSILTDLTTEAHTRGCSVDDLLGAGALESLNESSIARALYTAHMPDPDLVIRTSGEQRISNFLLWQIAYSEIFVTDRLWPDFNGLHLLEAINAYQHRERRFGGLGESFTDEDLDNLQPAEEVAEEIKDHLIPKADSKSETKLEAKADAILIRR